jgi:hypothetical protein
MHRSERTWVRNGVIALPVVAAIAGCGVVGGQDAMIQRGQIVGGATKQATDVQPVPGFLPQPGLLSPGGSGRAALVYFAPEADLQSYRYVMLDRMVLSAGQDSALANVPRSEQERLVNRFQSKLYTALSQRCRMVRWPAPGTIRLRFALTDARQSDRAVNTVATYAPYVSTAASAASLVFNRGIGYFAGGASAEGYATDATSGKLLWEAVDRRGGTGALVKNTLDTWLDVNIAMDDWADTLARRVQELGMCST